MQNLRTKLLTVWAATFPLVAELLTIAAEYERRQPGRWYVLGCCSSTVIDSAREGGLVYVRKTDNARTQVRLSHKGRQLAAELGR